MNKELISDIQGICLIILFISGSTLALPTGIAAGRDLWLAILLALVLAIPLYLIYSRLLSLYHGKDIFGILEAVFGKFFGKAVGLIFVVYAFHLGTLVLRDQGDYLVAISLPETPIIIPTIIVVILCTLVVKAGIEVLGRWSKLFVILNAPIPTIMILMLIPQMDICNIMPILYKGTKPFLKGTLQALSFPFGDVVVFLMVFFALKSKKSSYNVFIKGLLWGGFLIIGVSLAEILVLGEDLYAATYFPNHSAASKVSIGDLLQRLEVIVIVATLTSFFVKISICLLAVCNGISKILGCREYRFIVAPIALLMCNFSYFIHDNIIMKTKWVDSIGIYYFLPLQVGIPILILIAAEIKQRRIKNNTRRVNRK
ncbi:MAG: endospore germination permease [Maledivibacter sp.]|nr:endospore germination permease [Maledivibacter sp.]